MKIIECCPYYNESLLAELKAEEGKDWVDTFSIAESDYTFKYSPKGYNFNSSSSKVKYHQIDGKQSFIDRYWGVSRSFPFIKRKSGAWKNEALQRNFACENIEAEESDVVILSDIDEIIDSRYADKIIELVKKHEIITVRLHFTMFYLNLFSSNWHEVWPGSPTDYSYRVFVMTGRYFNKMRVSSNKLRRLGESSKLVNQIYCPDEIMGFHHSWLGDKKAVLNKIQSYAHDMSDHGDELLNASNSGGLAQFIGEKLKNNQSIFPGHKLEVRNAPEISFLKTIKENREKYDELFI